MVGHYSQSRLFIHENVINLKIWKALGETWGLKGFEDLLRGK